MDELRSMTESRDYWLKAAADEHDEAERWRGNFSKSLTAMGECLDCLEQSDDPDTVAIKILRDAMYGPDPSPQITESTPFAGGDENG